MRVLMSYLESRDYDIDVEEVYTWWKDKVVNGNDDLDYSNDYIKTCDFYDGGEVNENIIREYIYRFDIDYDSDCLECDIVETETSDEDDKFIRKIERKQKIKKINNEKD